MAQALLSYDNSNHSRLELTPMQSMKADLNYSLPIEQTHNEKIQNYIENYVGDLNDIKKHLDKNQNEATWTLYRLNEKHSAKRNCELDENSIFMKNPKMRKLDPVYTEIYACEIDST